MARKRAVAAKAEVATDLLKFAKTQRDLAAAVGKTQPTLNRYMQKFEDAPKATKEGYDVEAWRAFLAEKGKLEDESKELTIEQKELKNREIEEKVYRLRLENEEKEGRMIDVDEASRVIVEMAQSFVAAVLRAGQQLPPEAVKRLADETRTMLEELSEGAWAKDKKKAFWSNVFAVVCGPLEKLSRGDGLSGMCGFPAPGV